MCTEPCHRISYISQIVAPRVLHSSMSRYPQSHPQRPSRLSPAPQIAPRRPPPHSLPTKAGQRTLIGPPTVPFQSGRTSLSSCSITSSLYKTAGHVR
ncbi:hypothetical protein HETIRDRAFT_171893 [Heterobasidion irregulare TC 32-1]|uniref:Uncharacterized protein n=1 Tax=Heterobasidion irregulare (strain TC 32-1) TaxID=747525 RepID=W4K2J9_HETIT|nr:uncharacterized protein HETIRDRAFT_171893 [Heterobasidion irregulare TC 32-1]ETW79580.1 hypothetical protein HETIRDRAFT_171893 [Heterobasidion irregulare TC 32-1]